METTGMPILDAGRTRDPAIEDWSNLRLIHPLSRAALGGALKQGVSANMVSIAGLAFGGAAAIAYYYWPNPAAAIAGLVLSMAWLVADGLDGMIARATGTSSPAGRLLDGLCDHGVFACLYLALVFSLGSAQAWLLAISAGIAHAAQSSLYEAERARYHRRIRGDGGGAPMAPLSASPFIRLYEAIFHSLDRQAAVFDERLRLSADPATLAARYRAEARLPMKLMTPLSANTRVFAIFLSCLAGDPTLFWWFEIVPLTLLAILTIRWHRRVEARLAA